MSYEEWEAARAHAMKEDPLWRMRVYRLAAFAADAVGPDVRVLDRRSLTAPIASQLYRAVGSIGANIAEGYSRASARDRARLFEYALGSTRESRHWYRVVAISLGSETVAARCEILNQICHLLLTMIPAERRHRLRSSCY